MTDRRKRLIGLAVPIVLMLLGLACLVYGFRFQTVRVEGTSAGTTETPGVSQEVGGAALVEKVTHGGAQRDDAGQIQEPTPADTEEPCPT